LERVNIDSLHQRNLHYLAAEVFKWLHQIGPSFAWSNFEVKPKVVTTLGEKSMIPRVFNNTGLNSLDVRASQDWNHL